MDEASRLDMLTPFSCGILRFGPYFIEPVIAGISSPDAPEPNEPFIAATDLIGCLNYAKDFVVSGTAR
jgi:20S proteasome subunit beta 3